MNLGNQQKIQRCVHLPHIMYKINDSKQKLVLRWRKGYAVDCRSIYPGSIPGLGFKVISWIKRTEALRLLRCFFL
jgi:hypothetical protein